MNPRRDRLIAYLTAEREAAASALTAAAGGATLCQLHKDGRVTGGLKYDEGRFTAIGGLLAAVKSCESDAACADILREHTERWQADLDRCRSQPRPSIPWVAYAQGGLDACTAASSAMTEPG